MMPVWSKVDPYFPNSTARLRWTFITVSNPSTGTTAAGRLPPPSIQRFGVGRGTLLSMVEQGFGITIVGAATALLPTTGLVFLPFADEPEPVSFSAIWSPFNQSPAIRNMLVLAGKLGRICDSAPGGIQNEPRERPQ